MVEPLSLPKIRALAAETPYGGNFALSSMSAVTSLCAAVWLQDYENWVGSGEYLTNAEKDEIDSLIAELISDNLGSGSPVTQDFVKIGESIYTSDVVTPTITLTSPTGYRAFKVIISGLLTNYSGLWDDSVLMTFNGDTIATRYESFGQYFYAGGSGFLEIIGTRDGLNLPYCAVAAPPTSGTFGNIEVTIFNPNTSEVKHAIYDATVIHGGANRVLRVSGVGSWDNGNLIDEISITPYDGTTFLIDTSSANEPNELRLSVYGIK